MPYIYSTLTNDQKYTIWSKSSASQEAKKPEKTIHIKGGHGRMGKNLITPIGVGTEVTEEELKALLTLDSFNRHVERGFLTVEKKEAPAEKVASNMKGRDKSSQNTASDFEEPPVTQKAEA